MRTELGRKLRFTIGLGGVLALGFWLGHSGTESTAQAGPPPQAAPSAPPPSDYSQRVVAYIYGNVAITREDLGEYLIARKGADCVELLVNKKIIERACQEAGVEVTAAEVKAAFDQDCAVTGVTRADFVKRVLKQYDKSVYEWCEDVLRPRLLLQKYCQNRISIDDDDLRKEFEFQYGEKVDCRLIIWPTNEERIAVREFEDIRKSEEQFARKAANQALSSLAAVGGHIQPIARYGNTNPEVEKSAFKLQPGEMSELIRTSDGIICIKVDGRIKANEKVKLDDVREDLRKVVKDKKVAQQIPLVMKELREKAQPKLILKKPVQTEAELLKETEELLQQTGGTMPKIK